MRHILVGESGLQTLCVAVRSELSDIYIFADAGPGIPEMGENPIVAEYKNARMSDKDFDACTTPEYVQRIGDALRGIATSEDDDERDGYMKTIREFTTPSPF